MWDGVAAELSESFSLIMPDNRGMGRSVTKRPPRTLSDLAVDLLELLDALQLERCHVLGISLGGMIAQYLAVQHPSRIDKLVLVSTAHHFAPYLRAMGQLIGHALRYFPRDVFDGTVEVLGSSPRFIDTNPHWIPEKICTARTERVSRGAVARQLMCLAASEVAHIEYRIKSPTLIMIGEQDALIPGCYGREIERDIPGSELVEIPNCGHNPFIEQPEAALPIITQFLNRRDPQTTKLKPPSATSLSSQNESLAAGQPAV